MTNADRIRAMSDAELAGFIRAVGCNNRYGIDCKQDKHCNCRSMNGDLCHGIKFVMKSDSKELKWLREEARIGEK